MSRFLIAVNGSPTSEKALEAAVNLGQSHHARLVAVAVLDDLGNPQDSSLASPQVTRLDHVLQSATNFADARGLSLTPVLRQGHAAATILACAEEEHADLLVLGAGGQHGDERGPGSTADQVSNHSPCPVLLVNSGGWMSLHNTERPR